MWLYCERRERKGRNRAESRVQGRYGRLLLEKLTPFCFSFSLLPYFRPRAFIWQRHHLFLFVSFPPIFDNSPLSCGKWSVFLLVFLGSNCAQFTHFTVGGLAPRLSIAKMDLVTKSYTIQILIFWTLGQHGSGLFHSSLHWFLTQPSFCAGYVFFVV